MKTLQKRLVRRPSSSSSRQLVHSRHLHKQSVLVGLTNLLIDAIASLTCPDISSNDTVTNNA